jgi:hypothetical protein
MDADERPDPILPVLLAWLDPIYFYAAHIFGGLLTGAAALLTRHVDVREYMADRSTGELFTAVACLLNIVAIADVWSRCSRGDPETRIRARADADAETAAAAAAADAPPQVPSAAPSPAPEVSGG